MALLSVIRSWHFRKGMSFREISRRTGLSRNTVKKYLKTGIVEPVPMTGWPPSPDDGGNSSNEPRCQDEPCLSL